MAPGLEVRREVVVTPEKWDRLLDPRVLEHHRRRPKERSLACPQESNVSHSLGLQVIEVLLQEE